MILSNKQLISISGGGISASLINSIARGFNAIFNFGRTVGSAIRRGIAGKYCSI